MRGCPPYNWAKVHPNRLTPQDFLAKKTEISIAPNGEPQKSGTESVTVNSSTNL